MRLGCDTSTNRLGLRLLHCGKEQPNNIANLPKSAVHGRGATKPPAPVPPRTTSLKPTLACSLACHYTVPLLCVAIAARAQFEGVTTFDSYRACA